MESNVEFFYRNILSDYKNEETVTRLANAVLLEDELSKFLLLNECENLFISIDPKSNVFKNYFLKKSKIILYGAKQKKIIFDIGKFLDSLDTSLILLKSLGLNDFLYVNESRVGSDIDILIASDTKKKLLESYPSEIGIYQPFKAKPFEGLYEETWIIDKIVIDAHQRLTNQYLFNIPTSWLFEKAFEHPGYGLNSIKTLPYELHIIHLVIHIFNDGYLPHHSTIDLAKILKNKDIDKDKLSKYAAKIGCVKIFRIISDYVEKNVIKGMKVSPPILFRKKSNHKIKKIIMQYLYIDSKKKVFINHINYIYRYISRSIFFS
ncbi:nucleotidyltransferase family protein [Alteromonas sp. C1M14]|uniref:nucleotidyltransferase family protein n=1 Tax=Alteromonas sp. C1M14 TaxID=2841567 RepID=UPI001C09E5A6|nr:nucleotidyltransferase family protein [Alteromonas sp. C1M14]MBU2979941.1 nucleotidyltransferase family protein [Alteromonas sp. C1M14]